MNELALFAGAGGGLYGGKLLGWRCCCAVEIDAYARHVLIARQNDGTFPVFPIWDDVCTFDGRAWRGIVDVVSGGFPCQDVSVAGQGGGIEHGDRSGLWREYARIIAEVRPRYVFAENSPMLVCRGLHIVLRDLARLGYDAAWCVLSARDCGAPHLRKRMWVLATPPVIHNQYLTPIATDGRRSLLPARHLWTHWQGHPGSNLAEQVASQAVELYGPGAPGFLNPSFVEWLMGWPIGSTGLDALEMDRFQSWLQGHSDFLERF